MKLKDWLFDHQIQLKLCQFKKSKGLHVIGTCGECEFWGDSDRAWDEDARPYRICKNENEDENMGIFSPVQRRSNAFLKDFGCIHFKAKGEK